MLRLHISQIFRCFSFFFGHFLFFCSWLFCVVRRAILAWMCVCDTHCAPRSPRAIFCLHCFWIHIFLCIYFTLARWGPLCYSGSFCIGTPTLTTHTNTHNRRRALWFSLLSRFLGFVRHHHYCRRRGRCRRCCYLAAAFLFVDAIAAKCEIRYLCVMGKENEDETVFNMHTHTHTAAAADIQWQSHRSQTVPANLGWW